MKPSADGGHYQEVRKFMQTFAVLTPLGINVQLTRRSRPAIATWREAPISSASTSGPTPIASRFARRGGHARRCAAPQYAALNIFAFCR